MRLKGLGIGAAGILTAGTMTFAAGVQHVSAASCYGTFVVPTPVNGSCVEVEIGTNNGVIYNPIGGGAVYGLPGVYVIFQGNDNNPCEPVIQCTLIGYVGISDYETGDAGGTAGPGDPPCQPGGNGQSFDSNSGGSVGVDQLTGSDAPGGISGLVREGCGETRNNSGELYVDNIPTSVFLVAPVACGNVSGPDFFNTWRDGCWVP